MEECYENMNSYSDYNIFEVVSGNQNDIDNEFIIKI